jgi:cell wall-associated NlpC family hydrolase
MTELDRRLHAYRDDLADGRLRGRVRAAAFVEGGPAAVALGAVALRRAPGGRLDSQLLFGEPVLVFEERADGWAWVQSEVDGYVGWVEANALGVRGPAPTHRVAVRSTFLFPEPDIKAPVRRVLTLTAPLAVTGVEGRFSATATGWVWTDHLARIGHPGVDAVTAAMDFLHTPYLWGGRSADGVDCSGLVQLAWRAAGIACPRDTDMQAACTDLGEEVDPAGPFRRGDLIFWNGHVAIALDGDTVLNATAHYLSTVIEPFAELDARARTDSPEGVTLVRRRHAA